MARVDRYGEPLGENLPGSAGAPEHHCRGGWIDRDADNPVPCRICKPWLYRNESEETTP